MKKIYLMLLAILATTFIFSDVAAQVNSYNFATSAGTYTEITGGTVLGTTANDEQVFNNSTTGGTAPVTGTGFPIGFTFRFGGVDYSSFAVATNGFVVLGNGSFAAGSSLTTAISGTATGTNNLVSGFNQDLEGQTGAELSYLTTGSAPNRTLVVQWKGYRRWNGTAPMNYNFQIRLNETSNAVEVVYGTMTTVTTYTAQIGLKGTSNTDFNNRTTTTDWAATTAGAANTATCTLSSTVFPASGRTFTWAPNVAAVDWCNLQWPATATIALGDSVKVYTQAWEPGVTDAPGAGANLLAWIGVSTTNTNPATWPGSAWKLAAFNVDAGNNDEDSTSIGRTLGAGTYYYASRWQVAGGEYRYGGYNSGGGGFWDGTGNVSGVLTITPTLANDICSGATALTVNTDLNCGATTAGTTVGATMSGEVPTPTCSATGIDDDVWYSFVATGSSHVLSISGATNATAVNVYSGTCGSLTNIGCATTTAGALSVIVPTTLGTTYLVRVYSTSATAGTNTNFTICIGTPPPPPVNDDCAGAIAITCNGSASGDNTFASTTPDALSAVTCGSTTTTLGNNRGVWYTVTPANSGSLTISTCTGTQWDTYLRVYTGTCGAFTTCAGSDDDACSESTYGLSQLTFTATAGTTYYILLGGYDNNDFGAFTISASCPAPCATPSAVAVVAGSVTTTGASISWTGTGTFILEYGAAGFTPGTGATAGTGGTVINPATSAQAIAGLTANTAYDVYVRQDCTGSGTGYSNNSTIVSFTTATPAPANDNCATATVISTLPYNFSQTDGAGATQTAFVSACGSGMNDGVWYTLTGTGCNITVTVDPATPWDPELGIYTGSCGAFTCVDFADDGAAGDLETITFNAAAGTVYYINVGHYSGTTNSPEGPFVINVSACVVPPANDECAGAPTIGIVPVSGTTVNATETLPAGTCDVDTPSPNDVWYQFTTTSAGDAIVTVANTSGDVVVEAFTGTCGGTLTSIGCADNSFGTENLTLTGLTAGQTVYVRVYGYDEEEGTFDISVSGAALPVAIEYFRGTKQNNRNVLDWKVSCTGSPSVTLIVERSSDGRNYESIYTTNETAARCLQPFTQNDLQPLAGLNYYRLKTIDIDGKIGYSTVVVLMGKNKGFEIVSLAPNPVKNDAVLTVTSAERTIMEVVVRDIHGKQVSKQRVSLIAGSNQVPLTMDKVAAGVYTVSGLTADGVIRTLKFVKE